MLSGENSGEHPGAVLRRLRHTAGRRISQQALATLLGTSRAHVARLELNGFPLLTDEQLDRLERAGDAVRPPFTSSEIGELRKAMQVVGGAAILQADKAVKDIAAGAAQLFPPRNGRLDVTGDRPGGSRHGVGADPFESSRRPKFLTGISDVVEAAEADIRYLSWQRRMGQHSQSAAKPDLIMTNFGRRNLVEEAKDPETFRDAVREVLREGGTVEHLIAPSSAEAPDDLVALVPPMISYLGQVPDHGGRNYQVHVIPESRHPLAYGVSIAGNRGLLIARGDGDHAVAVRTSDPDDVAALRDQLRPYWEDKEPIIEEAGRRTHESVTSPSPAGPSVGLRFERILTSVEMEEGPRRLAKEGLSILNIPVAIHAWKWRAAELSTAGWIPEDLLVGLHAHAWDLAAHGLGRLPRDLRDKYPPRTAAGEALEALKNYASGLQARQAAWGDQLSRHDFWDATSKSALARFMSTGELPRDEVPSACKYRADRDDIELIITRLITRLRSTPNYHLALIEEPPVSHWFYFGVKAAHVLAQVFESPGSQEGAGDAAYPSDENMLSIHIDYAPIAAAFAGWFDEHVLKAATDPPWQDNRSVAQWLEAELASSRGSH